MLGHWDELVKRIFVCPNSRLPTDPAVGAGIEEGLEDESVGNGGGPVSALKGFQPPLTDISGGLPQVDGMFEPGGSLFCGQNSVRE